MPSPSHPPRQFNPQAAVLAWLWPGLGHISLGHNRRGRLIMLGVLFLFASGVLIGGADSVDRREDHLWFLAQAVCGPVAVGVDFVNQAYVKKLPDERRFQAIGINKPNEMGTLFSALAGLMNLIVILDAMFPLPRGSELIERRKSLDAVAGAHPRSPAAPDPGALPGAGVNPGAGAEA
jgi:hypothetical protein